MKQPAFI